jgi:hypothetical protein
MLAGSPSGAKTAIRATLAATALATLGLAAPQAAADAPKAGGACRVLGIG